MINDLEYCSAPRWQAEGRKRRSVLGVKKVGVCILSSFFETQNERKLLLNRKHKGTNKI